MGNSHTSRKGLFSLDEQGLKVLGMALKQDIFFFGFDDSIRHQSESDPASFAVKIGNATGLRPALTGMWLVGNSSGVQGQGMPWAFGKRRVLAATDSIARTIHPKAIRLGAIFLNDRSRKHNPSSVHWHCDDHREKVTPSYLAKYHLVTILITGDPGTVFEKFRCDPLDIIAMGPAAMHRGPTNDEIGIARQNQLHKKYPGVAHIVYAIPRQR